MTHVLGGAHRVVLLLAATLVGASCRAKTQHVDTATATSATPTASSVSAGGDRCAALMGGGPSRTTYITVEHPAPPGLQSASQWPSSPKAPPYIPEPKDWRTPAGVTFQLIERPRVERDRIFLEGELVNATNAEQRLYLWEAGTGYFTANLGGPGVSRRPDDPSRRFPEIYPATSMVVLPAGAHWVFELALILPCYVYSPGQAATVSWYFNLADHAAQGELPVKLP